MKYAKILHLSPIIIPVPFLLCGIAIFYRDTVLLYQSEVEIMNLLTPIICQVGAYRKENNDLPDSIEDYVTNKELQKYMHLIRYEKKNREDFHLLISDGFDPAAVYTSNNNRWISRDAPFPFKKQVIKVSC